VLAESTRSLQCAGRPDAVIAGQVGSLL